MHSRLIIAALAATFAMPVAAEPADAPATQTSQQASTASEETRPAEVLLASSEIRAPGQQSDGQATPPVKRRAARVTACRCGGQTTPQQP